MLFFNKSKKSGVDFNVQTICDGHHKVTYRGVVMLKNPFDYLLYQMLILEVKPDLIIEVGTNQGGCSLYFSDLLRLAGKGIVHTIDIQDNVKNPLVKAQDNIVFFKNGWQDYDIKENTKDFETILVIEDSSHTYENTIQVLHKFKDIVSKNSYFIVEDSIVDELGIEKEYGGGPLKAIKEFMQNNTEYVIDRHYCDFFGKNATFNVEGYLKKIK